MHTIPLMGEKRRREGVPERMNQLWRWGEDLLEDMGFSGKPGVSQAVIEILAGERSP